ncbi:MAG: quinolinate synthase NadA [Candidatus Geothermincolia bacterium]
MLSDEQVIAEIERLRGEREAIILVHNYQRPEIQDLGDYVGDSLGLARQAAASDAPVIIFCGVYFMAETANILSPDRLTILPEPEAGCPLADTIRPDDVRRLKAEHPGAPVVTYVNSTAEVKAESDYCCTSGNAVKVVEAIDAPEIIFVPDRNLGAYVAAQTGKNLVIWQGCCPIHEHITKEQILALKREHPDAPAVVHPECRPDVTAIADAVASTSGIFEFAATSPAREIIVGTEIGMYHRLKKLNPAKEFYFPSESTLCPNMKLITLEKVMRALATLSPAVVVPEDIRVRALRAVDRMVAIG